jgi:uncharacterized membrane protein
MVHPILLDTGTGLFSPALVIPGWLLVGAALAFSSRASDASDDGPAAPPRVSRAGDRPASPLLTGVLLGIGIIGFLDEAVLIEQ